MKRSTTQYQKSLWYPSSPGSPQKNPFIHTPLTLHLLLMWVCHKENIWKIRHNSPQKKHLAITSTIKIFINFILVDKASRMTVNVLAAACSGGIIVLITLIIVFFTVGLIMMKRKKSKRVSLCVSVAANGMDNATYRGTKNIMYVIVC